MTLEERRRTQRFNVFQFVDISFMKEDFMNVEGINISETGFLVKSKTPLDPYTKIYFMINLGDQTEPIKGEALSIHSERDGDSYLIGVQMTGLKNHDKEKLKVFLEQLPL